MCVDQGGSFTLESGTIVGNKDANNGGGVGIFGRSFTMTGGTISGNSVDYYGGGVYVSNGSTFNMQGGSISGNSSDRHSGGVYVGSGIFTMQGGSISGNSANMFSGGVYVTPSGTFNMQGGSISGNSSNIYCGGVFVESGSFTMTGGSISGNTARMYGGGVFIWGGSFTLSGSPEITGNTEGTGASAKDSNVYFYDDRTIAIEDTLTNTTPIGVTMQTPGVFTSGWAAQMGTADPANFFTSENADYKVYRDASGEARLSVPYAVTVDPNIENGSVSVSPARSDGMYGEGETVTILATPTDGYALNKFTVKQGQTDVQVTGNTFTMPAGDVSVSATFSQWKWLQEEMEKGGEITLERDYLCDDQDLGPLTVPEEKTVTLDLNGHILDRGLSNAQAADNGSVIVVNGTLTVKDSKPTAAHDPAITYTDPTDSTKTVTVTGGVITGGSSANGGGVYVGQNGNFILHSGSICGNRAGNKTASAATARICIPAVCTSTPAARSTCRAAASAATARICFTAACTSRTAASPCPAIPVLRAIPRAQVRAKATSVLKKTQSSTSAAS